MLLEYLTKCWSLMVSGLVPGIFWVLNKKIILVTIDAYDGSLNFYSEHDETEHRSAEGEFRSLKLQVSVEPKGHQTFTEMSFKPPVLQLILGVG